METTRDLNKNESNAVYGYETIELVSSKRYNFMKKGQNESTSKAPVLISDANKRGIAKERINSDRINAQFLCVKMA